MHPKRFITTIIISGGLGLVGFFASGCGDDSKTTGTQLQLTPKDKADIEGMRGAMKGRLTAEKQENAENRRKKN
jgi:hypothetical protein